MSFSRYLFKIFGMRILAALAALVGILLVMDLLEVTPDILDRGLGAGGVGYYALLKLPRFIEQAAPVAALAGSLFAFAKLAGESAVTAMRSTGMSAYRITLLALPAAAILALTQLSVGQLIAPRTDEVLTDWLRAHPPQEKTGPAKPDLLTFRLGGDIVVATLADPDGRRLTDLVIYRRDAAGRLQQRTMAPSALYDGRAWQLMDPQFQTLMNGAVTSGAARQMNWTQPLRPDDIVALAANQPQVTPSEARRALSGGAAVRPRTFYDTQVQRAWAGPVACLVMLLLAAPAGLASFRGGGTTLLAECLGAGLLFLVVDGAFTALGESGAAPSIFAAWAAPAMFAALGATALVYLEG